MALDYVWEGLPPKSVPYFAALGLDNGGNVLYVSSKANGWVPIGGGLGGGPIVQASMQFVNTDTTHSITQTALLTTLYAVSIYLDALGDGGPSDTLVATLTWTQPSTSIVHSVQLTLTGNTDNVQMETYPILAKENTPITVSCAFSGAPFHYDISARLVQMPGVNS